MKLCINKNCLEVAKEEWYNYCPHCGKKLFHAGTIESEEAEMLIEKRMKYRCDGCQKGGFSKKDVGHRHCDIGIIVKSK
jgi:hypothetical protein